MTRVTIRPRGRRAGLERLGVERVGLDPASHWIETDAHMRAASRNVVEWALPGLVAGMMFAMFAMVVGIFTSAPWAPPQGIAQAIEIGRAGLTLMSAREYTGRPAAAGSDVTAVVECDEVLADLVRTVRLRLMASTSRRGWRTGSCRSWT